MINTIKNDNENQPCIQQNAKDNASLNDQSDLVNATLSFDENTKDLNYNDLGDNLKEHYKKDGSKQITETFANGGKKVTTISYDESQKEVIDYDTQDKILKYAKFPLYKKSTQLWTPSLKNILIFGALAVISVMISRKANSLWGEKNGNISHCFLDKNWSKYAVWYISVNLCNLIDCYIIKCLVEYFAISESSNSRMSEKFIQTNSYEDLSHRTFADQKYIVESYNKAIYYGIYAIGRLIFDINQYINTSKQLSNVFNPWIVASSLMSFTFISLLVLKKFSAKYTKIFMNNEENLREILHHWNDKNSIQGVLFPTSKFQNYIKTSKIAEIIGFFLQGSQHVSQQIALVFPYLYYSRECVNGVFDDKVFRSITQSLNGVVMSMVWLDNAIDYWSKYEVCKKRLEETKINDNIKDVENKIIVENLTIQRKKNETIIKNLNLNVSKDKKIHIFAAHGTGKSSIFWALCDKIPFEGDVYLPESVCTISEKLFFPKDCKIIQTQQFRNKCELLKINPNLDPTKCSASQKFRLAAAFALCHDFIIWDDPFNAGENDEEIMKIFLKNIKSGIVLSASKKNLDGYDNYMLINDIDKDQNTTKTMLISIDDK